MTRRSKRDLERAVEDLDAAGADYSLPEAIVWEDPETIRVR